MIRIFTLLLLILVFESGSATAQKLRVVSGRLTGTDGSPLPGVNITVKGTSKGTQTDSDGAYSIEVPVGSTLVFSFIGMKTREILVNEDNFQPADPRKIKHKHRKVAGPIPRSLYQDSVPDGTAGVATFTYRTPSYRSNRPIRPEAVRSIKNAGRRPSIRVRSHLQTWHGIGLQFTSAFGMEEVNRLPSLQSTYSQGRPIDGTIVWQGADRYEPFSWGPAVNTLEYDGSNYAFDKNGQLVARGSGNGIAA